MNFLDQLLDQPVSSTLNEIVEAEIRILDDMSDVQKLVFNKIQLLPEV